MITDNKIDSLPTVAKIMAIIPGGLAVAFIYAQLLLLGVPLLLLVLMGITAQQRVKVDFSNRLIKNYYRILGLTFGEWVPLKDFSMISLTPETTLYRETNYGWNPANIGAKMFQYRTNTIVLNLKVNNREKYVIAKGNFEQIYKLAELISDETKKDIFDCTLKVPKLINYQERITEQ